MLVSHYADTHVVSVWACCGRHINTVFAGILVLTVFALLLDFAVTFAENKLLKWRPQQAQTETT